MACWPVWIEHCRGGGGWRLEAAGAVAQRSLLAKGGGARPAFLAAREEWKLLTAAAVNGMARRAIEIAAAYSTERIQWDRPIGAFQAIAHPLADSVTAVDGGRLLIWDTAAASARGESVSWGRRAASRAR